MASIISAGTTSGTSLNLSADTSGVLQLATNGTTTAVTIDTSQNVGIGTASPGGYKLAVGDGSGNRGRIMLKGATGGSYPEINIDDTMNTSGKNYQIFSTGGHLKFQNQTDAAVSFVANAFGIGLADNAPVDGDGIRFPATQSASSNANTLDDYEEGTWTPVIGGETSESGQSYNGQTGNYIKVGRLVTVTFRVVLSTKGTITGNVVIKGLPFTIQNSITFGGGVAYWDNLAVNWSTIVLTPNSNTTYARVDGTKTAASVINTLTTTDISNNTQFNGSFTYFTN